MPYQDKEQAKAYAKAYYDNNKLKIQTRASDYFKANRAKCAENTKQYLRDNFEYQLYRNAKGSAKQRNLEFDLERSDIIIPVYCPYLGIELTRFVDGGRQESNASLDRVDNTKGYTKGNIQVISSKANFMKRNASIEELLTFARNVIVVHG